MKTKKFGKTKDRLGFTLSPGDLVRMVGHPDLSTATIGARREMEPVFRFLQGKYKRIKAFSHEGWAEIEFKIRSGKLSGRHTVWIEPNLLRRKK